MDDPRLSSDRSQWQCGIRVPPTPLAHPRLPTSRGSAQDCLPLRGSPCPQRRLPAKIPFPQSTAPSPQSPAPMFESLQDGLTGAFKTLRGQGKLTEGNMRDGLQAGRTVAARSRRQLHRRPRLHAAGHRARPSARRCSSRSIPAQQIVGIVYQELVDLMGPVDHSLHFAKDRRRPS